MRMLIALSLLLPFCFQNCSRYKTSEAQAQDLSEGPSSDEIIAEILKSSNILIELTITFPESNPIERQLITVNLMPASGVLTLDNSNIRRADGVVIQACTMSYNDDKPASVQEKIGLLTTGNSTALNADGLNYELTLSDLNGHSLRYYLAGSPMAVRQLLMFLNGETLAANLRSYAVCPATAP